MELTQPPGHHPHRPVLRKGRRKTGKDTLPCAKFTATGVRLCKLTDRKGSELWTVSMVMGILEVTRQYQKETKF